MNDTVLIAKAQDDKNKDILKGSGFLPVSKEVIHTAYISNDTSIGILYKDIKIGQIYKLKKDSYVWCPQLQESVKFKRDEIYVRITHTVFDQKTLFGNLVVPNMFGTIEKSEIEFSVEQLCNDEVYDSPDEYCAAKTPFTYMDFPYIGNPVNSIDDSRDIEIEHKCPKCGNNMKLEFISDIKHYGEGYSEGREGHYYVCECCYKESLGDETIYG